MPNITFNYFHVITANAKFTCFCKISRIVFSKKLCISVHQQVKHEEKMFKKSHHKSTRTNFSACFCVHLLPLRKKCPYSEFFWSVFSRIWTVYAPYSSKCGKIRTRKTPNTDTFYRVYLTTFLHYVTAYL